jgi:hypothetical protein
VIASVLTWLAKHPEIVEAALSWLSVSYYFYLNFRERPPPKARWQYVLWAVRERLLFAVWDHPGLGLKRRWPKVLGPPPTVSQPPPLEPPLNGVSRGPSPYRSPPQPPPS